VFVVLVSFEGEADTDSSCVRVSLNVFDLVRLTSWELLRVTLNDVDLDNVISKDLVVVTDC